MPIIDKELVNETPMENMKFSNQGIGDFLLDIVKINIAEHGDSQWMVSLLKYLVQHITRTASTISIRAISVDLHSTIHQLEKQ